MGPSPGAAQARPGPVHFSRDLAWNFEKGPSSTQARDRFFEKGLEIWDFYVVKNRGPPRLEIKLLWRAWARAWLKMDFQGSGLAQDWFFRARRITNQKCGIVLHTGLLENQIVSISNLALKLTILINKASEITVRSITCFSYILMILLDFVLMISLDLMKSSEVRKAGDKSKCITF